MNYATIKYNDVANGPGVRTSLFVSGCTHRCKGCFNEVAWDFDYGEKYTKEVEDQIIESLKPSYIKGLTLLGGEPFEPQNQEALVALTSRIRKELPTKTIWCFSGYTIENMLSGKLSKIKSTASLLNNIDILVDGPFVESEKSLMLKFRGSKNQRIIEVKKTLEKNEIILWEE
ncbi:MAG: anaerobic ribonucleoside-triphosphate reductase activating protein [Clostridia bacterium]|nr:anaerobic ribonucleoside-triphosphate reductase activating protein [Clostridia bacterium]MBQ7789343.1 anaerobic ribonucleoside-triphosphate reductase activating protein [Clostridia bacterium]